MKCLTLTQPWATLVVLGAKRIETRCWQTIHRGPLAIHASKRFPPPARALLLHEPFKSALAEAGITDWAQLPTGLVIGTVTVMDCQRFEEIDRQTFALEDREGAFGDFRPGRWGWLLNDALPLATPFPWRGALGLFDLPDEMMQQAMRIAG